MTDKREAILERLTAIAEGLKAGALGYATAGRNLVALPDDNLPALVVLDGSEEAADVVRRRAPAVRRMRMTPQILVLIADQPENAGPALNARRAEIVAAVTGDAEIIRLTGDKSGALVQAVETGLSLEGGMLAIMAISLAIQYTLDPSELAASA